MSQGSFDTLGTLKAVFVADVQSALKAMDSFGAKLQAVTESTGSRLEKIGKSFDFLNTLIGAGIATKGFDQFKKLDQAMNDLASSLGKTNEQFASTRTAIVQFASDSKVPVLTLTEAMRRFTVVGSSVPEAMNLAVISMRGAKAAMVDVGVSANVLSLAMKSFDIPASRAADVMGKLVIAGQRSTGGFTDFGSALAQLGPLASNLGGNLDEVLGILRLFSSETGNVAEGAVKLRAVFQELLSIDPFTKQGERLREVLGSTVEVSLSTRGLADTLKLIVGAANGSTEALREMVGSGRTLVAFTRLMKAGFDELDESVNLFANTGVRQLTEEYESQKNTVSALIKETGKLVSNAVALAFERNTDAIKSAIKGVNEFVTNNRELLSTLVQTGVYLSAGVVALGAFKLAALATSKVIFGIGGAIEALRTGLALLSGALSLQVGAGLALATTRLVAFGAALRGLLFADFAGGAVKAALSLKVLTDAQLAAAAAAGVARNAKGQFVSRIIEVGDNVVTASTKVLALRGSLAALGAQLGIAAAVATVFYLAGREIGNVMTDTRDELDKTSEAIAEYRKSHGLASEKTDKLIDGIGELNGRFKEQAELLKQLTKLYADLANAKDLSERVAIEKQITATTKQIDENKPGVQTGQDKIAARKAEIEADIAAAREAQATRLKRQSLSGGESDLIPLPKEVTDAQDAAADKKVRETQVIEILTNKYLALGKTQKEALALADAEIVEYNELSKAQENLVGVTDATTAANAAMLESQKAGERAISAASAAAADAEKAVKGLADSLEAAGQGTELEKRLERLDDISKSGRDGLKKIAAALAELDAAIAQSQPGDKRDELESRRNGLAGQQRVILKSLEDIEKAKDKARADAAAKDQKAVDDQLKQIDALRVETLRSLGLDVEADRAASNAKLQDRLRSAEELRKSTIKNAGQLADIEISEAKRAYAAEIDNIARLQKEKEEGYATAQAARQKAEDDAKRAELLSQAAALSEQADAARKRGDLRAEQVLREKIRDLIQQAGSRSADLLEKERDLRQTAKERLDLVKQEVDSRLRLGEGGAGIVDASRKGLRDIAGAESASEFRGAVRGKLGQTQTEAGAKELFGVVKQLLEAEFVGLQQQAAQAAKAGDKEGQLKAQQGQKDVAERYRILNDELKRTIGELKRTGGKPAESVETPTLVPGSQVRPDEKVPANVKVIGPATKDKAQIDAANAARARGEDRIEPIRLDPDTPLKLDDSTPIRVIVTNPDSQAGFDPGPLVGPPASGASQLPTPPTDADRAKQAENDLEAARAKQTAPETGGGVGPLGFARQALGAASVAASVALAPSVAAKPIRLPNRDEARAGFEDKQEAQRGAALNSKAARARAEADARIAAVKRTSTPEDAKKRIDQINKAHDEQFGSPTSPNGFRTSKIDIPGAPETPGDAPPASSTPESGSSPKEPRGASPTPGIGVPDSSGLVKQTLDAVAGAAKGLQATATQLLDAIKASGDATVSAIGVVNGKLGEAVGQLNENTVKIKAIEDEAARLRVEGRS